MKGWNKSENFHWMGKNFSVDEDWKIIDNQTGNYTLEDFGLVMTGDLIYDNPKFRTILIIAYVIVFAFCFFGNLAVILVVTLHWKMRSVTKFFLGNLAFANLCVAAFCIFQNLSTHLMDSWPFGVILCKMYHFTNSLSYTASILILVVISVERYLVLLHPFKYRRILTIQRLRVMILGVWGLSALLCSPKLYYNDIIVMPLLQDPDSDSDSSDQSTQGDLICTLRDNLYDNRTEDMINFIVLFAIPMTIMTILYTKIALYLRACEELVKSMDNRPGKFVSCPDPALPDPITNLQKNHGSSSTNQIQNNGSTNSNHVVERTLKNSTAFHSERCLSSTTSTSGFSLQGCSCCGNTPHLMSQNIIVNPMEGKNPPDLDKWKFRVRFRKAGFEMKSNDEFEPEISRHSAGTLKFPEDDCNSVRLERSISRNHLDCVETFQVRFNEGSLHNTKSDSSFQEFGIISVPGAEKGNNVNGTELRKKNLTQNRSRKAAVPLLIVIVVSFAVCNLPYHSRKLVTLYVKNYNFQSDFNLIMSPVTYLLTYVNCAINPILYAFMSKSFRASFKELIKCRCRREANTGPDFFA